MQKIPVRNIQAPGITGSFSIRDLKPLLSGQDMIQPLHRHNFFHILILEKARGEHHIDFVRYPISNHAVFFMRPGQAHQLTLKKGASGYLLEFTRDFYSPVERTAIETLRRVSNKPRCQLDATPFKRLHNILSGILQEYSDKQEHYYDVIRSQLDIFFIGLLRQSRNSQTNADTTSEYRQHRLDEFQQLIEQHIAAQKQVAWYAKQLHLSPYQLNGITKTTLGKTGSRVIDDYIILEARRHLLATTNQVNQIADLLGYEDVSYFIRFFKKHTGHSPESYRQNFK